jgi:hypothetical protein
MRRGSGGTAPSKTMVKIESVPSRLSAISIVRLWLGQSAVDAALTSQ